MHTPFLHIQKASGRGSILLRRTGESTSVHGSEPTTNSMTLSLKAMATRKELIAQSVAANQRGVADAHARNVRALKCATLDDELKQWLHWKCKVMNRLVV